MQKKPRYYLACSLLFLANLSLLGGCVKKHDTEQGKKTTLTLNFQSGDVPSLIPHDLAMSARGLALGKWLFEGLTCLNSKGEYELNNAERVEVSPDKTRYTFHLRPSYYSDGSPVLATDYVRSWREAISPESKCGRAHLFYLIKNAEQTKKGETSIENVGIKALNDHTLLIELSYPAPFFLKLLSSPLFAPFKRKEGKILGNGLYEVAQWERRSHLTLKLNQFFKEQGNAPIEIVNILMLENEMTALDLYKQGKLDWIGPPFSPLPAETLTAELENGTLSKEEITRPFWIFINTEIKALSSPFIRQALSCVIDRYKIAEHVFIGDQPLLTPLPPSLSVCDTPIANADLAKGRELFQKGLEQLGLTKESFPRITLSCFRHSSHKHLAEYLKEQWEQAFGIEIDLENQEWVTFSSNLRKGNYAMGGCFCGVDYHDPLALLEQIAFDKSYAKWTHAPYRALVEQAKKTVDPDKRLQYLKEAEEILKTEVPIIPIVNQSQYYLLSPNIKGIVFNYRGTPHLRWAHLSDDLD